MSAFVTTMFVSLSSPLYPQKPKPLAPISTLQQSESCTNFEVGGAPLSSQSSPKSHYTDFLKDGLWSLSPSSLRSSVQSYLSPTVKLVLEDTTSEKRGSSHDISTCRNSKARNQFRPQQKNKERSNQQLRHYADATLGTGSLRKVVKLPEGEDINEWLAVNGVFRSRQFAQSMLY